MVAEIVDLAAAWLVGLAFVAFAASVAFVVATSGSAQVNLDLASVPSLPGGLERCSFAAVGSATYAGAEECLERPQPVVVAVRLAELAPAAEQCAGPSVGSFADRSSVLVASVVFFVALLPLVVESCREACRSALVVASVLDPSEA